MSEFGIDVQKLLEVLPKLIRENDTVKGAIITALSGVVATREDIKDLIREMDKRFEAMQEQMDKRFEAVDKRFEAMQELMDKRFEAVDKRFEAMQEQMDKRFDVVEKDIKRIAIELATLGTRSGDDLEAMVRDLLTDVLVEHRVDISDVEKIELVDETGAIFEPGYRTSVDVVTRNGRTTLYEIKYRADQRDAYHFTRVAKLYERTYGQAPDRLVMLVLEMNRETLRTIAGFATKIDVIAGRVVSQVS